MRRSVSAALLVALLALASTRPAAAADEREDTASFLAAGGSIAGLALVGAGLVENDFAMGLAGGGVLLLAPSLGHWYAGEADGKGLGLRLGGAALVGLGGLLMLNGFVGTDNEAETSDDEQEQQIIIGLGVGISGLVLGGAGVLYSVLDADDAVRRRAPALHLAPMAARGTAGMMVGGTFD
jgi:hypothetical protein